MLLGYFFINTYHVVGTVYCIHCDCRVEYCLKSQRVALDIRGIAITYDELVAYCSKCGAELYVPEINDANVVARKETYEMTKHLGSK